MRTLNILSVCGCFAYCVSVCQAEWKIADGPLLTRWVAEVSPEKCSPRVSVAPNGPQGLAKPQWTVGFQSQAFRT